MYPGVCTLAWGLSYELVAADARCLEQSLSIVLGVAGITALYQRRQPAVMAAIAKRSQPALQGELADGHLGQGWTFRHLDYRSSLLDVQADGELHLKWQLGAAQWPLVD